MQSACIAWYGFRMAITVQVRDVPDDIVEVLKARAEAQGKSLASFVRELMTQEAATPSIEDIMRRIASREPIDITADEVQEMIEDGRR